MERLTRLVTAVLLACLAAGCGSEKDRGINRDRDKPRTPAATAGDKAG